MTTKSISHEEEHRLAEISAVLEEHIAHLKELVEEADKELLWWKKRVKKELNLEL